jgi:hypothetical protein
MQCCTAPSSITSSVMTFVGAVIMADHQMWHAGVNAPCLGQRRAVYQIIDSIEALLKFMFGACIANHVMGEITWPRAHGCWVRV